MPESTTTTDRPPRAWIPMFARAILGGKKVAKMEARVSDDLKEAAVPRLRELGFTTESQYLEFLVSVDCYGLEHVRMVHNAKFERVRTLSDTQPAGAGQGAH